MFYIFLVKLMIGKTFDREFRKKSIDILEVFNLVKKYGISLL